MSLLDVFTTVYDADTKGLESGNKKVRQSTDEIVAGLKDAEDQSKETGTNLQTMLKGAVGWFVAVAGASKTVKGALDRAADIEKLSLLSRSINTNIQDLDAFRKAVQVAGGDSEAALGQLNTVFDSISTATADWTSGQSTAFRMLGVSVTDANGDMRDTVGVLLDVTDAMQGMEKSRALDLAQQLGITDKATLDMMLKGREEMEAMLRAQKEQGVVSKESVERAAKFTAAMHGLRRGAEVAKDTLSDALLPALTWITDALSKMVGWFNENKNFVIGFFTAIAGAVMAFYLPSMIAAAAATLAATWPFLLIGAAIGAAAVALGLIYDDIMNFIAGNDSLIGQIMTKFPFVKDMFESVGQVFNAVVAGIVTAMEWAVSAFDTGTEAIGAFFTGMADGVMGAFRTVWDFISSIIDGIKESLNFVGNTVGKIGGWLGFGGDKESPETDTVSAFAGQDSKLVSNSIEEANVQLNAAAAEPMNPVTRESISNSRSVSNENNLEVGQIVIQTQATDARGISQDVGSEIQDMLANLRAESASGVTR